VSSFGALTRAHTSGETERSAAASEASRGPARRLYPLGGQYADRIGALVYLDAAEDPTLKLTDYDFPPADRVNLAAFRGKPVPVTFPPAEQRLLDEQPIDPTIRKAITEDHLVRPDYARIKVPVLAVYRSTTLAQALKDFPPTTDREREAVELAVQARRAVLKKTATTVPL
jgi:hypothetical protein